jgi:exosortase B
MSAMDRTHILLQRLAVFRGRLPRGVDPVAVLLLLAGLLILYVPTIINMARTIWAHDAQSHGPIIFAVSLWLLFTKRSQLLAISVQPWPVLGWATFLVALLLYVFGRSQDVLTFEAGSLIVVVTALFLVFASKEHLRAAWFPIFFLVFMIPLPDALVAALTGPLKSAVSAVAAQALYLLGYPVARSGVILYVGQYQLLVADACAGLSSMFTLEALGLLYMNLMNYTSVSRNLALATLLVPIAFAANVVRVIVLVLVTFYFGDEVGQGFVHGFAGMFLFIVALLLMLLVDRMIGLLSFTRKRV